VVIDYIQNITCCFVKVDSICRKNGSHQHKFGSNRSNTDHTLYICQLLEKKWEYYGAVYEIFIAFKKAFDLIMSGVLCNILIQIAIRMKLGRLIRICLNETFKSRQVDI
jgi:hypothetical protein